MIALSLFITLLLFIYIDIHLPTKPTIEPNKEASHDLPTL